MNTSRTLASALAAAVLAVSAGQVLAADPAPQGKTREQVKAELAEALRTGDIVAGGDSGMKLNELFPNRYPAKTSK